MQRSAKRSRTTPVQPTLQTNSERTATRTRIANKTRMWGSSLLCLNLAVIPIGCQSETDRSETSSGPAVYAGTELAVTAPGSISRHTHAMPAAETRRPTAPASRTPALDLVPGSLAANSTATTAEPAEADSSDAETYEPNLDILPSASGRSALVARTPSAQPPQVVLSAEHKATCRIHVGATFPDLELTRQDGSSTTLSQTIADRPAVVFFWNEKQAMSLKQIHEMRHLAAKSELRRDALSTLALIAIHVGPRTEQNESERNQSSDTQDLGESSNIVVCHDQEGEAFGQVATPDASTPRSFVLDGKRQVVWLDIEYSRATRRQLQSAIDFVVKQR